MYSVVDSWSSTCDVDYFFFVWDYVCGQGLSANLESESHKAAVVVFLCFLTAHMRVSSYSTVYLIYPERACIHVYTDTSMYI